MVEFAGKERPVEAEYVFVYPPAVHGFKINKYIRPGYAFRVVREWQTPSGMGMVELAFASGKPIPWRNKLPKSWCVPMTAGEFYYVRYPEIVGRLPAFREGYRRLRLAEIADRIGIPFDDRGLE